MTRRAQMIGSAMALLSLLSVELSRAQGLQDSATIDAIVGSPVREEKVAKVADQTELIDAINRTDANIGLVRKLTNATAIEIVPLETSEDGKAGLPDNLHKALLDHASSLVQLRQEIEGNALLFHAVDFHHVLMRDIIAIAFDEKGGVTIFTLPAAVSGTK